MEYRKLGATGLKVSELSLGCMTFGRESSEEESRKMIDKFIEVGGNVSTSATVHTITANGTVLDTCTIDSSNASLASYMTARGGVIIMPRSPLRNQPSGRNASALALGLS